MKTFLAIALLAIPALSINAQVRIIEQDATGNKLYHKQQYVVDGNRIFPTDSVGNREYHKGSYVIQGDKLIAADAFGNLQYHKPSFSISKPPK